MLSFLRDLGEMNELVESWVMLDLILVILVGLKCKKLCCYLQVALKASRNERSVQILFFFFRFF